MPLAAGTRLGPYEILGPLGAGGMGEVYRARDTRLARSVAIKILPSHLTGDPVRRARLEREAKAVSSLNHPHICTLYDVGQEQGTDYLVMELVEGKTLAECLRKGPLPLDQTLRTAIEIADALDKAHRQGLIHRDLKPGNVMLTKSGSKLMDFGLAKHAAEAKPGEPLSELPTAAPSLTGERALVGTIAYMAPEQLEGKEVDARSDLWAFGCVLYEMATGKRAFEGKSLASLISAIMDKDPSPILQLQPLTPPALERLVKVCLAKDPDDRLQTAHDVMQELKWISDGLSDAGSAGAASVRAGAVRWGWGLATASFSLILGLIGGIVIAPRLMAPPPSRPQVVHSLLEVAPAEELDSGGVAGRSTYTRGGSRTAVTWTPDGRSLVFVGRRGGAQQLYIRALNGDQAEPLDGTEGSSIPAVSPDGHWLAFWAQAEIRRVPIAGGPPATVLGKVKRPSGIAWGADGRIFYGPADCGSERSVICAATPDRPSAPVTKGLTSAAQWHGLPHVLPGGRALLYTVGRRSVTWGGEEVVVLVLATGESRTLLTDAVDARYAPSGHLVFLRRGTLFAVLFDLERLRVLGTPVPVHEPVVQALTGSRSEDITGAGQFSVASNGALALVRGPLLARYLDQKVVAIDRRGNRRSLDVQPRAFDPRGALSPDGLHLAVPTRGVSEHPLWSLHLDRGTLVRLTREEEAFFPRWTPDGRRITYVRLAGGVRQLVWQQADGTGTPEVVLEDRDPGTPSSWSPDGRHLALARHGDIHVLSLTGNGADVRPFLETPEEESGPEFSPDGRWLAYASTVSGRSEVYVRPYPGPGPAQQVSLEGGYNPVWGPSGRELVFVSLEDQDHKPYMMSAEARGGSGLEFGKPRPLFVAEDVQFTCRPARCHQMTPDGRFFYILSPVPAPPLSPVTQIQLITNWTEEMKARVAAGQAK